MNELAIAQTFCTLMLYGLVAFVVVGVSIFLYTESTK